MGLGIHKKTVNTRGKLRKKPPNTMDNGSVFVDFSSARESDFGCLEKKNLQ
jgi:hypothetical protein